MKLEGPTLEAALQTLAKLKSWSPYRFGGKWFIVAAPSGVEAYRTKKAAENCCRKFGIGSYSIAQ